jgi:hypothetical protein
MSSVFGADEVNVLVQPSPHDDVLVVHFQRVPANDLQFTDQSDGPVIICHPPDTKTVVETSPEPQIPCASRS